MKLKLWVRGKGTQWTGMLLGDFCSAGNDRWDYISTTEFLSDKSLLMAKKN